MSRTAKNKQEGVITIKKYANRRLYNTETSSYVTLDDLCQMVKEEKDFAVYDAKSGEDLTRQILTQIIYEQESRGQHLLPIKFLRSIIGYYGDYSNKMRDAVPPYLEAMMETFSLNQDQMRQFMAANAKKREEKPSEQEDATASPLSQFEEIGKQNMALFQKAFQMWSPFENNKFAWGEEGAASTKRRASGGKKGN